MSSLLALSFHPAFYPPKSGGEERLYNIYSSLSKNFKVKLITFTYPNSENVVERVTHNENFTEIRVPKTKVSAVFHHFVNRCSDIKECSAVVTSIESRFNKNFKEVIETEIRSADIVIFVYPFLYTVPERLLKNKKVVYESHNLEYELMKDAFSGSTLGKFLLDYVFRLEKSLSTKSDCIFTVSEENKTQLASFYKVDPNKIYLSPNGVNPGIYNDLYNDLYKDFIKEKFQEENFQQEGIKTQTSKKQLFKQSSEELYDEFSSLKAQKICAFIGSYHPPNIEAIENIQKIALKMPDTIFLVAGNASQYFIDSGLVEKTDTEICREISKQKVILKEGFYGVEYWDSIPTVWCKPEFGISLSDSIESLEMKVYSPEEKELKTQINEIGSNPATIKLNEGWSQVKIDRRAVELKDDFKEDSKDDSKNINWDILFECKPFKNNTRNLGVALQEISYSENGEIFRFDLSKGPNQPFTLKAAKNVVLLGRVTDEEKKALYKIADLALNPMTSGSGTNIKMLDYMAAGLPVISTPVGARGLDLEDSKNALICEISDFPERISRILADRKLYTEIRNNGRKHVVEKFDWSKIAAEMGKVLGQI